MYAWLDKHFAGEYVQDWTEFEHPQLGAVEIGGLDTKKCIREFSTVCHHAVV